MDRLARVSKEHGIPEKTIRKMQKVQWPEGFKMGDAGEESINNDGKPPTLKEDYTGKRNFV